MKAQKLIDELQEYVNKYGDLDVDLFIDYKKCKISERTTVKITDTYKSISIIGYKEI